MTRNDIYKQFTLAIQAEEAVIPTMVEYKGCNLTISLTDYSKADSAYISISPYGADMNESLKQYLKDFQSDSVNKVMDVIDAAYNTNEDLKKDINSLIQEKINAIVR